MKPPTMDLSLYSDTVTVRVGQKLHLRIPYSGNPTPEFAWLFANSALLQHMKLNQSKLHRCVIRHVNSIPTMQFVTGISGNTQSKSSMLSLTEYVWVFQNNALWDTL